MSIEATNPSQDVVSPRFSIREREFRTTAKPQRSNLLEDFKQEAPPSYVQEDSPSYVLEADTAFTGFYDRYFMQSPHHGVEETEMRPGRDSSVDESNWNDAKNDRRCELIDKEIKGTLLPAEKRELEELQRQMLAYRRKVAPLPLKEAQRLHQQLLKKAAEQED